MGIPPARIEVPPRIVGLLMLAIGGIMLLTLALLGWALGGIPDGNRYNREMIVRESEPTRFWFKLLLLVSTGAGLIAIGVFELFGG